MKKDLFSSTALSSISSPEQLDQHIKIVKLNNWIVMVGALSIIAAIFYWCFFGNITNSMRVTGIVFPQSGVSNIVAVSDGLISDILVKEGEYVEQGQIIMFAPNKQIIEELIKVKKQLSQYVDIDKTELQKEYENLLMNYEDTSIIKAEASGIVQNIVAKNTSVSMGQIVCSIINDDTTVNSKELIIYVPYSIAEKFKSGMEAQISPVYAPREEYGFIKGYVTSVGAIPVTAESFLKTFGTKEYVKDLITDENVVELRIMMAIDSTAENSFLWSNPKGKTLNIDTGTICNVLIIFDNVHPIELLFRS